MKKSFKLVPLCSVLLTFLCGCDDQNANSQGTQQLLPVKYEIVKKKDVTVELTLTGRTKALKQSEVRPQVAGIILKRLFVEGSEVKKGQQLYQIDPSFYEASLAAAKADLAKAEAAEYSARVRAERYKELIKSKAVSQQDFDDAQANYRAANAQIMAAKAALKTAEINLAYTKVYAPIDGIIGKSEFTEGALVNAYQSTPLAVIQQIDPIYVDLGESVNDLLQTRKEISEGQIHLNNENKAEVKLIFENGQEFSEPGILEFTGVAVDEGTGMVTIRATANNPNHVLLPGMFMRAKIQKGVKKDALTVPQSSVTRANRSEKFVYVIDSDNKIQQKFIEITAEIPGYFVVGSGIEENDRIVVSNIQKVSRGMPVTPVDSEQKNNTQGQN